MNNQEVVSITSLLFNLEEVLLLIYVGGVVYGVSFPVQECIQHELRVIAKWNDLYKRQM